MPTVVPSAPNGPSLRTRADLLDAAARVLAADPSASLHEIAQSAGVGRSTLHRYFPDRASLIHTLAMESTTATEEAIASSDVQRGTVVEVLRRLIDAFLPMGDRFHFLLFQPELESDHEWRAADFRRVAAPLDALVERGRRDGSIRNDLPRYWPLRALESLVYAAWRAVQAGDLARREAGAVVHGTLMAGIGAPERPAPRTLVARKGRRRK